MPLKSQPRKLRPVKLTQIEQNEKRVQEKMVRVNNEYRLKLKDARKTAESFYHVGNEKKRDYEDFVREKLLEVVREGLRARLLEAAKKKSKKEDGQNGAENGQESAEKPEAQEQVGQLARKASAVVENHGGADEARNTSAS